MSADFLILHDPLDPSPAADLRTALENDGASCRVRALDGVGEEPLDRAMSRAGIVVVVIPYGVRPAFSQLPDIATIRDVLAGGSEANRIVLVLVSGADRGGLPSDFASAPAYDAGHAGWAAVATGLGAEARSARPATVMVGHSMGMWHEMWDELVTARTGRPAPPRESHGLYFDTVGHDLVARSHGNELRRITPEEYERQLTAGQLDDAARIEKAMEINLAARKRVYPTRVVNEADGALYARVNRALAGDLDELELLLRRGGFWLDDHYDEVRDALRSNA